MKLTVLCIFFFATSVATAEEKSSLVGVVNPAAVRIADAAQPSSSLIAAGIECMEKLENQKYCEKLVKEEAGRSKNAAHRAAQASKHNHPKPRPVVVADGWWYGSYSGGYYGRGVATPYWTR